MYFQLLYPILTHDNQFNIYLDIKDTRSNKKVKKLSEVLCNSKYDFDRNILKNTQQIRSHETVFVQLADLFSGALCYFNRALNTSDAKISIIDKIKERSGYSLNATTLLKEEKFNLFYWQGNNA